MYFLYSLLLTLGFLVLIPRFLFDALRHGKYVAGFGERLGRVTPVPPKTSPIVWIHCVSVGESQAARPLVSEIHKRFPDHTLVISTTTLTGQRLAREIFKSEAARVFYFPFDWAWTVRRTLKAVRPDLVLIMETEIWPRFFRECESRGIPLAIVNGRLSSQSFRRYMWIRGFLRRVLRGLTLAVMQTKTDAERIIGLGLDPERAVVSGSMKFDAGKLRGWESISSEFYERFNISSNTPLLIAASTHAPEESLILDALTKVGQHGLRLLLAPRHPERFAEVAALLDKSGRRWSRRSDPPAPDDKVSDVILLDTIGELSSLYSSATLVFVGGSIAPRGGHNILEPAAVGSAIITGPHTFNFAAITRDFVKSGAIVQLHSGNNRKSTDELSSAINDLLTNAARRSELQEKAKALVQQNLGATERTIQYLYPLLARKPFIR